MLAATKPWWPHLFSWPRFLDPISWLWLSVKGYAFTSSGEEVTILGGIALWAHHHQCVERRCFRLGHADPDPEGHGHPICRRHQRKLRRCV